MSIFKRDREIKRMIFNVYADLAERLEAIKAEQALIVLPEPNETVERAARNIPGIKTTLVGTLSAYEILKYKMLILTEESAKKIEEVYA